MVDMLYETVKNLVFLYYKNALILGVAVCGINQAAVMVYSGYKKKNSVLLFLFSIYLYSVFVFTILSRTGTYISEINLLPLASFQKSKWERMYFFVNILLFFPMPIFLYMLYSTFRTFKNSLLAGLFTSMAIEAAQYILHCGWCDIDDILSNTSGVVLGWLCIHGIYRIRAALMPLLVKN